ncbi:MAG: hypothetical protein GF390_00695 [Candidatus Pacebacteria bacterium]|nr:hypothetical protein [Candidatus Paceibacterota bacterium]
MQKEEQQAQPKQVELKQELSFLLKKRYWKIITIILALLLALISIAFYFSQNEATFLKTTKTETETMPASLATQEEESLATVEELECTGNRITDYSVGFSITCPSDLKLYTYQDKHLAYNGASEKMLYFCESQINPSEGYADRCTTGGILIWANGDDWEGECEPENRASIHLNGEKKSYCLYPERFDQLYVGDLFEKPTNSAFLIQGSFSDNFTKEDALEMLSTFQTLPDISEWNIYENEEYGFKFKYPDGWEVEKINLDADTAFHEGAEKVEYMLIYSPNKKYQLHLGIKEKGNEKVQITTRTGVGAGDFVKTNYILVNGLKVDVYNLVFQDKVQEVFFGKDASRFYIGEYELVSYFSYSNENDSINIDKMDMTDIEEVDIAKRILSSLEFMN